MTARPDSTPRRRSRIAAGNSPPPRSVVARAPSLFAGRRVAGLRVLFAAFDGLPPSQVRPGLTPTVLRLLGVTTEAALDSRPLIEGLRTGADLPPEASAPRRYEAVCRMVGVSLVQRAVVEGVGHTRYIASLCAERP